MTKYRLIYLTTDGNRVTGTTLYTSLARVTRAHEWMLRETPKGKIRDIEIEEVEDDDVRG